MHEFESADFDGQTLRAKGRWAVLFQASWCPFCRAFAPKFARLERPGPFEVAQVDLTDLENPLWERFEVEVVPSVLIFVNGRLADRVDGIHGAGLQDDDLVRVRALASAGEGPSGA